MVWKSALRVGWAMRLPRNGLCFRGGGPEGGLQRGLLREESFVAKGRKFTLEGDLFSNDGGCVYLDVAVV